MIHLQKFLLGFIVVSLIGATVMGLSYLFPLFPVIILLVIGTGALATLLYMLGEMILDK